MIFGSPIPFEEALEAEAVKSILPTAASSAQLSAIAPALRERALFSARTTNAGYLAKVNDVINRIISPETIIDPDTGARRPAQPGEFMSPSRARVELRETLQSIGFEPDPTIRGTIKDLSSDARLNLLIETNTRMAQGYGDWSQGQDPAVLDQWPAQELFRLETREVPRNWVQRWRATGGQVFAGDRMIALKNEPIWTDISAFGLPYPPFDFNSGMGVVDVDRDEAVDLGIIDRDTQITPESRRFNEDLSVHTPDRHRALFTALLDSLGGTAEFADGVLTLQE